MLATHVPGPHSEAPAGRSTWAGTPTWAGAGGGAAVVVTVAWAVTVRIGLISGVWLGAGVAV